MDADTYKVYEATNFTRKMISPKEIGDIDGYKEGVIVRFAEGMPSKGGANYTRRTWKRVTIDYEDKTYINYTPNQVYILNDKGDTIDVL